MKLEILDPENADKVRVKFVAESSEDRLLLGQLWEQMIYGTAEGHRETPAGPQTNSVILNLDARRRF